MCTLPALSAWSLSLKHAGHNGRSIDQTNHSQSCQTRSETYRGKSPVREGTVFTQGTLKTAYHMRRAYPLSAKKDTLTISTTKRLNTCWLPNLIWWRIQVSKMKSCNGSCSQRACTACCSVFSLFELSSQKMCWDALGDTEALWPSPLPFPPQNGWG